MFLLLTFTCASADTSRYVYALIYYFDDVGISLKLELMSPHFFCVRTRCLDKGKG